MKRVTFEQQQITIKKESWEKTGLACPKCGAREVWREVDDPQTEILKGRIRFTLFGEQSNPHACVACAACFTIKVLDDNVRYRAIEKLRLKGALSLSVEQRQELYDSLIKLNDGTTPGSE